MKKIVCFILMISTTTFLNAQVFNTARTLNNTKFSTTAGLSLYDGGAMLLGKIGYGLGYDNDVAVTMGFGDVSYLGVDFEKELPWEDLDNFTMSLSSGLHHCGGFAIDVTWNCSVPLDKTLELYGGLDMDLRLTGGSGLPVLMFLGAEYAIRHRLTLLGEVDLGLNKAGNSLGVSVCYYFSGFTIK